MALYWNSDVKILQVQHTSFTVEAQIEDQESKCLWWMIGIYANCNDAIRKVQWTVVNRRRQLWGNKWLLVEDFNDITSNSEKRGGRCRAERSFNDFRDFISANQLVDLGYEGQPWTWCNNWGNEGEIKQGLDRAMSSADWNQTFENAKCSHIKAYTSDHCALMIDTKPTMEKKKRRFFFDKRWLQHEEISEVVKEV
ncbi:uncharacterized protein [Coffea arabica]|uniref:Uncharacterized protein n=1 Tax=Coffea arabica TaxID=13443 RepID=A0ABM4UYQ3_COFAR